MCHFTFSLVFTDLIFSSSLLDAMPSFPLNVIDDEEDTLPAFGNLTFSGILPTGLNLGQPVYECVSCEQPDCSEQTTCKNAFQVFILHQYTIILLYHINHIMSSLILIILLQNVL